MAVKPSTFAPTAAQGCAHCGKQLSTVNVSGLCRKHAHRWRDDAAKNEAAKAKFATSMRSDPLLSDRMRLISNAKMAWCPVEYRDEYRRLTRVKMLPAADARKVIEDLIATHAARYSRTGKLQQAA